MQIRYRSRWWQYLQVHDSTAVGCGKTGTAFCYNRVPTVRLFRQHPLKTGTHGMLHLSYFSDFVPSDSNNTSSNSAVVIASTAAAVLVGVEVFVSESVTYWDNARYLCPKRIGCLSFTLASMLYVSSIVCLQKHFESYTVSIMWKLFEEVNQDIEKFAILNNKRGCKSSR